MTAWKYTDASRTVVIRILEDGRQESCLAELDHVQAWVAEGNTIEEPDAPVLPPEPTKAELMAQAQALLAQIKKLEE